MTDKRKSDVAFGEFTWRIENFSKLDSRKMYSDTFEIGSFKWRVLIFPKGNNVFPKGNNVTDKKRKKEGNNMNYLSLYLDAADSRTLPIGWKKFACFKLKIIDQVNRKMDITKEAQHHFCAKESDWGFTSFMPLTQLWHRANGFLLHDTIIIVAEISVEEPANEIAVNKATTITTPLKSDGQVGVKKVENPQEGYQGQDVIPAVPLSQVNTEPIKLDFRVMGQMEEAFIPLLEDVCLKHPSLIECQLKQTRNFREWAFIALGRVLYFLMTKKTRDMNNDACKDLQILWDELKTFRFDLNWLEPRVKSALSTSTYLERAEEVKRLKENVASLEMKIKSMKANVTAAEIDLEIARGDLARAEEDFEEKNIDDQLGY